MIIMTTVDYLRNKNLVKQNDILLEDLRIHKDLYHKMASLYVEVIDEKESIKIEKVINSGEVNYGE